MYHVILADDEPLILAGLKCKIDWQAYGFDIVQECMDGRSLLNAVSEKKPDLLIMDIQMPQATGIDVMRELRTQHPVHVIVISGYSDFSYAHEALRYGVLDYLLKPVSAQALSEAVAKARKLLDREAMEAAQGSLSPLSTQKAPANDADTTGGRDAVVKIKAEMQKNFAHPLSLNDMAKKYHMDKSYLSTLFHRETGETFTEHLTNTRVRRACEYLTDTSLSHGKIAQMCGFSSDSYMKRVFRKVLNTTPSVYRKANSPK